MGRAWVIASLGLVLVACSSSNADFAGGGGTSGAAGAGSIGGTTGTSGASGAGLGGMSGASGSAGHGGASGTAGSGGHSGASGSNGLGGFGGCGFCGAVACNQVAITLNVTASGDGGSNDGVIGSITAQASGVTLHCARSGCGFMCTSQGMLADGNYSVALGAPGYQTKTIPIDVTNPVSCGCCGCCPFSTYQRVSLVPDGSPITGCCADTMTDSNNCGSCGSACASGSSCAAGKCTPVFAPCITSASGNASCTDYCEKQGKTCAAACGVSGTDSLEWWGQGSSNCEDNNYSSNGTCDQSLAGFTGVRCCCAG